ncbi:MAG: membrane protein insertion efficiency factor YidD [Candidatus Omnitrophica bacterium]|nr:membrane protein insertion efficiency factor YidD [Candidatus Omnitrophota bacterium]
MQNWKKRFYYLEERVLKKALLNGIDFYRNTVSSLKISSCRFYPSCSEYMREAIEIRGIFKGVAMGFWRILRCNPFFRGGHDPVEPCGRKYIGSKSVISEMQDACPALHGCAQDTIGGL